MSKRHRSIADMPGLMALARAKSHEIEQPFSPKREPWMIKKEEQPWTKKRKGAYWSKDEEEYLMGKFDKFVAEAAKEHARTQNAIICRIFQNYGSDSD